MCLGACGGGGIAWRGRGVRWKVVWWFWWWYWGSVSEGEGKEKRGSGFDFGLTRF